MDDLISRQAAIGALDGEIKLKDSDDVDNVARYIQQVALKINELPSAEKKAKILNANPVGECSACGWLIDYRDGFNYCPGCGARLILIIARGAVQEWRKEKDGSDQQTGGD